MKAEIAQKYISNLQAHFEGADNAPPLYIKNSRLIEGSRNRYFYPIQTFFLWLAGYSLIENKEKDLDKVNQLLGKLSTDESLPDELKQYAQKIQEFIFTLFPFSNSTSSQTQLADIVTRAAIVRNEEDDEARQQRIDRQIRNAPTSFSRATSYQNQSLQRDRQILGLK